MIVPSGSGAERTATQTWPPSACGMPILLVDAAAWCARRARRGAARAGSSRRRARAATEASDGRADRAAPRGTPSIRAIASFALRTTPCGSQTRMPSSRRSGSASGGAAAAGPSPAGAHPVSDAADGADEVRGARVVGELAAQVGDVDVDEVVVAEPVLAPHALEQLRAAERDARLGGQRVEQVELDPGELERDAVELDLAGRGVDRQRAERARIVGVGARGWSRRRCRCGAARPSRGRRARRR